ncbi:V-type ATP synthase subunit F [Acetivibrio mesophilus]|jgi:V/A-type H+-transporting ATPase subunit F|uniref:V-type ATP synthase subunit F n=1 Tax=Acetivibrio mesophilus TaxID=2487273 RepID=A0A4Q0I789_9FIRM|nr:V-type ATP synthase subunit F [Acetivibrio mesophilus]ODM27300.1 V-type ATP synthase subunit F [Clostridium sp. Bc-iso-3]RXE58862.1 V-type ATP synthase subunit F [Acetivibrio mesophilus]HHV29542.1 V-type ATP synthase subunit F [Clostridium sp.]
MYKVGVIGDKDSILGFKALGMSVFPVTSAAEAQETIDEIAAMQYAVIYITEQFAKDIVSTIDKYKDHRFPAIILIPGNQGSLGIGMMSVKKSVERAVGADILFKDE